MKPAGNRSTAVMQRREATSDDRLGPRGFRTSLDYFPTPPWATRAACEFLIEQLGECLQMQTAWEPACGEGFMTRPLAEYFGHVVASDVQQYSDHRLFDFTLPGMPAWAPPLWRPEWIFTNPPFQLAAEFVRLARQRARRGVVMFVRGAFTEGDERYRSLFRPEIAPAYVVTYVERVVLLRDRLIRDQALDPFNLDDEGRPRKASSATSYAIIIWLPGQHDTRHRWIPKCRRRLERDGDYPVYAEQWAKIAQQVQPGGLL